MEKNEASGRPVNKLGKLLTYNKELVEMNTPQPPVQHEPEPKQTPEPQPAPERPAPAVKKVTSKRSSRFGRYKTDEFIQAARTALAGTNENPEDYKRTTFVYPVDDDANIKALAASMGLTVRELVLTTLYREMSRQEKNGRFVRQRRFGE